MSSCRVQKMSPSAQLRFLDSYTIPHHTVYNNTWVGGLSGIDYNAATDEYIFVCDDRSERNEARLYKATIRMQQGKIDTIIFTQCIFLRDENGKKFPSYKEHPAASPDPESVRWITNDSWVWSSEGDKQVEKLKSENQQPMIAISDSTKLIEKYTLPKNWQVQPDKNGIRRNGSIEGISFSPNKKTLWACTEEPIYEDGEQATTEHGGWSRFTTFDVATKKPLHQFAYPIEAVAHPSQPADAFKINGISEILSVGKNKCMVMERSFSTGRTPCTIRLYIADFSDADDILSVKNYTPTHYRAAQKKLLLNLDTLPIETDNVEGICWGPILDNGHATLWLVSDDNFSDKQKTQVLLFELLP